MLMYLAFLWLGFFAGIASMAVFSMNDASSERIIGEE